MFLFELICWHWKKKCIFSFYVYIVDGLNCTYACVDHESDNMALHKIEPNNECMHECMYALMNEFIYE